MTEPTKTAAEPNFVDKAGVASVMYRMAIYAAVATMHFYRDDIVAPAHAEETLGVFAQRNSEVIKRMTDEVRHYFGYELSHHQIGAAIGAYLGSPSRMADAQRRERQE